jgi:hypothetical protein
MKTAITRLLSFIGILALAAMACSVPALEQPAQNSGAIGGTITTDLNGNGTADGEDGPLANVIVSLSGCGEARTVLSGADGSFIFSGLPTGVCILEVTKDGWTYSGSYPDSGYPIPVTVNADHPSALVIYMRPSDQTEQASPTPAPVEVTATPAPTDIPLTATPTTTPTPTVPMVAAINKGVNCRLGPSISYEAIDALLVGNPAPIIGKTEDSSWWQIHNPSGGNGKCFVAASATKTSGDLSGIPIVEAPVPKGAPVILSVDLTEDRSSGSLIIDMDINFKDSEGDVNYADVTLISTTANHELNIHGGPVNVPSAEQKAGASAPGTLNCGGETYNVTLSITLLDKAGHRSEPYIFTMVCD